MKKSLFEEGNSGVAAADFRLIVYEPLIADTTTL
jgi:hypothetical protein